MTETAKLLQQIVNTMNLLGGHCYYKDLYQEMLKLYPNSAENYSNTNNWKASIRSIIERFSSDSEAYKQKNKDIFYSIDGIGKGHWGLRNPDVAEDNMDISAEDEGFSEGKLMLKKHLLRERNHSLKTKLLKEFKATHNNKVFCEICGFDFSEKYGKVGQDFIEMHHLKPISKMNSNERTNLKDLVLLCSNCHSMIHRKRPWLTRETLAKLLNN